MPISSLPLPGDEEPPDSSSQVAWLRSLGDREALFQLMDGERRSAQGLAAAEALAQLGDVRGLDHLIATLNNPNTGLRMEAAEILQQLNHPRGIRALQERQVERQSSRAAGEREDVYEDLNAATTDELMAVWHENDRVRWTDLEFEVIEAILTERLGALPPRAGDSSEDTEIDEDVDPRIQSLWMAGDIDRLMRIWRTAPEVSMRLEAAEALADLGDEAALDHLIDMLDDADEELSEMAAEMLDWLDLPPGNRALRERSYAFEADGVDQIDPPQPPPPRGNASAATRLPRLTAPERRPENDWMQPDSGSFARPLVAASLSQQERTASSGSALATFVTGAAGGALGFLAVFFAMDFFGIRQIPDALRDWLEPSVVYWLIESLVLGGVGGSLGRRAARAMATRGGDEVDEQDASLALGALTGGAALAIGVGVLRFMLGS